MLARIANNATWLTQRSIPELARTSGGERCHRESLFGGVAARCPCAELDQSSGDRSVATRTPTRRERRRSPVRPYVGLIEQANENLLRALLRERQMVPENCDDLFEVWALLTLVERHLNEGGRPMLS
jgi:hypothetical protein